MKNLLRISLLLAMILLVVFACNAPAGGSGGKDAGTGATIVPGPDINGPGLPEDNIPTADPDKPTHSFAKSAAILRDDLGWLAAPTQWNVSGVPSMENYYMVFIDVFGSYEQSEVRFYKKDADYAVQDMLLWRNNIATFRDGKFLFTLDANGNWNGKIALSDGTPLISY